LKSILIYFLIPFCLAAQQGKDNDAYFNFLEQIYLENSAGFYNSFLENELHKQLNMFPESMNQPQILHMLADIRYQNKRIPAAVVTYLRLLFQFPQSESALQVKKDFPEILDKDGGIIRDSGKCHPFS